MIERKSQIYFECIRAVFDGDIFTLVTNIHKVFGIPWFSAHLGDLLNHCGLLAT